MLCRYMNINTPVSKIRYTVDTCIVLFNITNYHLDNTNICRYVNQKSTVSYFTYTYGIIICQFLLSFNRKP